MTKRTVKHTSPITFICYCSAVELCGVVILQAHSSRVLQLQNLRYVFRLGPFKYWPFANLVHSRQRKSKSSILSVFKLTQRTIGSSCRGCVRGMRAPPTEISLATRRRSKTNVPLQFTLANLKYTAITNKCRR